MRHATAILRLLALAFLLVLGAASVRAEAMSFQMVTLGVGHCRANCPQVIAASGEIDEAARIISCASFMTCPLRPMHASCCSIRRRPCRGDGAGTDHPQARNAVIVARPGAESSLTGDLFSGKCYSACVYALMGGRKRVIPPQSKVGVHRMFNYATNFSLADGGFVRERYSTTATCGNKLARYTTAMGVSSASSPRRAHLARHHSCVDARRDRALAARF